MKAENKEKETIREWRQVKTETVERQRVVREVETETEGRCRP